MAKQRPKNELISKNTIANEWIIASNDSISKMKLVEKKLKKHDTSSVVHEIQSLVECIEDIFKKSDIDTQSNILLSNMNLRVQQRDFIRNLMKLLIIYRILLTNWDNEHFEESAILLVKEVRDSFKKMVRTRKSLHIQFRLDTDTNTNPSSICRESFEINSQRYADSMSSTSNVQQSMTRSSSTESMIIEKYSLPRKCSSIASVKDKLEPSNLVQENASISGSLSSTSIAMNQEEIQKVLNEMDAYNTSSLTVEDEIISDNIDAEILGVSKVNIMEFGTTDEESSSIDNQIVSEERVGISPRSIKRDSFIIKEVSVLSEESHEVEDISEAVVPRKEDELASIETEGSEDRDLNVKNQKNNKTNISRNDSDEGYIKSPTYSKESLVSAILENENSFASNILKSSDESNYSIESEVNVETGPYDDNSLNQVSISNKPSINSFLTSSSDETETTSETISSTGYDSTPIESVEDSDYSTSHPSNYQDSEEESDYLEDHSDQNSLVEESCISNMTSNLSMVSNTKSVKSNTSKATSIASLQASLRQIDDAKVHESSTNGILNISTINIKVDMPIDQIDKIKMSFDEPDKSSINIVLNNTVSTDYSENLDNSEKQSIKLDDPEYSSKENLSLKSKGPIDKLSDKQKVLEDKVSINSSKSNSKPIKTQKAPKDEEIQSIHSKLDENIVQTSETSSIKSRDPNSLSKSNSVHSSVSNRSSNKINMDGSNMHNRIDNNKTVEDPTQHNDSVSITSGRIQHDNSTETSVQEIDRKSITSNESNKREDSILTESSNEEINSDKDEPRIKFKEKMETLEEYQLSTKSSMNQMNRDSVISTTTIKQYKVHNLGKTRSSLRASTLSAKTIKLEDILHEEVESKEGNESEKSSIKSHDKNEDSMLQIEVLKAESSNNKNRNSVDSNKLKGRRCSIISNRSTNSVGDSHNIILFRRENVTINVSDDDDDLHFKKENEKVVLMKQEGKTSKIMLRDSNICRKALANLVDDYSAEPVDLLEKLFQMVLDLEFNFDFYNNYLEKATKCLCRLFAILDCLGIKDYKENVESNDMNLKFDLLREFTLRKDAIFNDLEEILSISEKGEFKDLEVKQSLNILYISIIKEYEELLLVSKCLLNDYAFLDTFAQSIEKFDILLENLETNKELSRLKELIKDLESLNSIRREQEEQTRNPELAKEALRKSLIDFEKWDTKNKTFEEMLEAEHKELDKISSLSISSRSTSTSTTTTTTTDTSISLFDLQSTYLSTQPSFRNISLNSVELNREKAVSPIDNNKVLNIRNLITQFNCQNIENENIEKMNLFNTNDYPCQYQRSLRFYRSISSPVKRRNSFLNFQLNESNYNTSKTFTVEFKKDFKANTLHRSDNVSNTTDNNSLLNEALDDLNFNHGAFFNEIGNNQHLSRTFSNNSSGINKIDQPDLNNSTEASIVSQPDLNNNTKIGIINHSDSDNSIKDSKNSHIDSSSNGSSISSDSSTKSTSQNDEIEKAVDDISEGLVDAKQFDPSELPGSKSIANSDQKYEFPSNDEGGNFQIEDSKNSSSNNSSRMDFEAIKKEAEELIKNMDKEVEVDEEISELDSSQGTDQIPDKYNDIIPLKSEPNVGLAKEDDIGIQSKISTDSSSIISDLKDNSLTMKSESLDEIENNPEPEKRSILDNHDSGSLNSNMSSNMTSGESNTVEIVTSVNSSNAKKGSDSQLLIEKSLSEGKNNKRRIRKTEYEGIIIACKESSEYYYRLSRKSREAYRAFKKNLLKEKSYEEIILPSKEYLSLKSRIKYSAPTSLFLWEGDKLVPSELNSKVNSQNEYGILLENNKAYLNSELVYENLERFMKKTQEPTPAPDSSLHKQDSKSLDDDNLSSEDDQDITPISDDFPESDQDLSPLPDYLIEGEKFIKSTNIEDEDLLRDKEINKDESKSNSTSVEDELNERSGVVLEKDMSNNNKTSDHSAGTDISGGLVNMSFRRVKSDSLVEGQEYEKNPPEDLQYEGFDNEKPKESNTVFSGKSSSQNSDDLGDIEDKRDPLDTKDEKIKKDIHILREFESMNDIKKGLAPREDLEIPDDYFDRELSPIAELASSGALTEVEDTQKDLESEKSSASTPKSSTFPNMNLSNQEEKAITSDTIDPILNQSSQNEENEENDNTSFEKIIIPDTSVIAESPHNISQQYSDKDSTNLVAFNNNNNSGGANENKLSEDDGSDSSEFNIADFKASDVDTDTDTDRNGYSPSDDESIESRDKDTQENLDAISREVDSRTNSNIVLDQENIIIEKLPDVTGNEYELLKRYQELVGPSGVEDKNEEDWPISNENLVEEYSFKNSSIYEQDTYNSMHSTNDEVLTSSEHGAVEQSLRSIRSIQTISELSELEYVDKILNEDEITPDQGFSFTESNIDSAGVSSDSGIETSPNIDKDGSLKTQELTSENYSENYSENSVDLFIKNSSTSITSNTIGSDGSEDSDDSEEEQGESKLASEELKSDNPTSSISLGKEDSPIRVNQEQNEFIINPKRISVTLLNDFDLETNYPNFYLPGPPSRSPTLSILSTSSKNDSDNEANNSTVSETTIESNINDAESPSQNENENESGVNGLAGNEEIDISKIDVEIEGENLPIELNDNKIEASSLKGSQKSESSKSPKEDERDAYVEGEEVGSKPVVQKLALAAESDDEFTSTAHTALAQEDGVQNTHVKNSLGNSPDMRKSVDVVNLTEQTISDDRRPSVNTVNLTKRKLTTIHAITGIFNKTKNKNLRLTYIAPHGAEFMAGEPIPPNPYYLNRANQNQNGRKSGPRRGSNSSILSGRSGGSNNDASQGNSRKSSPSTSRKGSIDIGTKSGNSSRRGSASSVMGGSNVHAIAAAKATAAVASRKSLMTTESNVASTLNMDSSEKTVTSKAGKRRSSLIVNGIDITELNFLGYDYTDEEVKYKDGMLIYATIKALVEKLTLHDSSIDSTFIETFLLTFRAFCKPPVFLDHLIERYLIKPPEGINEQCLDIWRTHKQTAVKIRVNNVLKIWLESYFYIKDDGPVLEKLMAFIGGPIMECMPSVATRLLKNCESLLESYKQENESSKLAISKSMELKKASALAKLPNIPPPLPNIGKGIVKSLLTTLPFRITDLDPMEVARQLTIMDCKSFCGILPHELIGLEFSKKDSPSVKYVRMMTDTTNEITSLICDCILKEPDVKKRCNIVKYFIRVGENLLILKNYNSLIPIVGALNSSMIARLKRTWAILPPKFEQTFDQLRKATDHSKNYAEYRNVLKTTLPPCLPFLGIYLTDLTFTDEGNSAFQEGGDDRFKLVNFAKYARTVSIVQEIQKFQVPYNIIEVKELQIRIKAWLKRANEIWDEDKYYNNSLALEPRGNKQPALTTKSKQAVKELAITDKDVDLALVAYF